MIDILSLPRRHTLNIVPVKNIVFKSGLPINSLPGWETIPLDSKLPMLKCPGNQVIFSKNKIGQSCKDLKQEFDSFGHDGFPEYNPLHDINLKTFYANEKNLRRLRENGEITNHNDVICNLKDFNEYRLQLHKSQLYYVMNEVNRLESEQRDRLLIINAEAITARDHLNLSARQRSYSDIVIRKRIIDERRARRFRKLWEKTQERFQRIVDNDEMQKRLLEHKKILSAMKMRRHLEVCREEDRKKIINLKKSFQFKKERLKNNLKILEEKRRVMHNDARVASWSLRLNERITNQRKIQALLEQVSRRKENYIENHRRKCTERWAKIQEEIRTRARSIRKPIKEKRKRKSVQKEESDENDAPFDAFRKVFDKLVSKDLLQALKIAVEMHSDDQPPFDLDDPIYKAAKFILKNIIETFNKDLSHDPVAHKFVSENINKYFDETKKFVLYRATQIISHTRDMIKKNPDTALDFTDIINERNVSFSTFSPIIGVSSYAIHPSINLKDVAEHSPTPPGSLASIPVESHQDVCEAEKRKYGSQMCRNDIIFVEHFVIKFKHQLIVGVGRRVFAAIYAHYNDQIMDVRKELLELDKKFLVEQMSSAILGYACNSLNYDSCIKLCISALASDIIWSLQKHILRPKRDPRGIVLPRQCCLADANNIKLCLFCEVNEGTNTKCPEEPPAPEPKKSFRATR